MTRTPPDSDRDHPPDDEADLAHLHEILDGMGAKVDRELSRAEVAKRFGVTTKTIRNWEKTRGLRRWIDTPGGHARYLLSEVMRFRQEGGPPHDDEGEEDTAMREVPS